MDEVTRLGNSLIQHGDFSRRVYLMKLDPADLPEVIARMRSLSTRRGYTKIFAKVPRHHAAPFLSAGFIREAAIPRFFHDRETGDFLGLYVDPRRADPGADGAEIRHILELTAAASASSSATPATGPESVFACLPADAEEMSEVYRAVFATYPFPIHDPAYLRDTMSTHVAYFGIRHLGKIVALASSEMDTGAGNVEMTDFATLPQCRGRGLAGRILAVMEEKMRSQGLSMAFTIARALSAGMNITFSRRDYRFGGTLINNTQISGRIESMNVWYKKLERNVE